MQVPCGVGGLWPDVALVAVLIDNEIPKAVSRAGRAKVPEVEGQDRESVALRGRHDGCVSVSKVKIGDRSVQLNCAPEQARSEVDDGVLPRGDRRQEQSRGVWSGP